jgi:archaetidylinositol phosphate synthase
MTTFRDATRRQESWLAPAERRVLRWLAMRTPAWVQPDHLTTLGLLSMAMGGICYAASRWWAPALLLVNVWLAANWFGDSLDGTLARVRGRLRPRYGFYVDHMVDSFGALFLIGGLAASGRMSERVAVGLLVSFLLLSIHSYLATHTDGRFQLSFLKFSPTEIRVLLMIGNAYAYARPQTRLAGVPCLFFDAAGAIALVCMAAMLIGLVARQTAYLYREERLP